MNGYSPAVMDTVNSFNNMSDASNRVEESSSVYGSIPYGNSIYDVPWNVIEDRNSSIDIFQSPIIERQGFTETVKIGPVLDSFQLFSIIHFTSLPAISYKKISLSEARSHAITVLENAEKHRKLEREIELKFWESLDKYDL